MRIRQIENALKFKRENKKQIIHRFLLSNTILGYKQKKNKFYNMNIIHNKERERERKRVIIASDNNIKIYHNNNNNNNKCQRKTCIKTK